MLCCGETICGRMILRNGKADGVAIHKDLKQMNLKNQSVKLIQHKIETKVTEFFQTCFENVDIIIQVPDNESVLSSL